MYTQVITPAYYPQMSPAQFLNQAAARLIPPVQQVLPAYPTPPRVPVSQNSQAYSRTLAFDTYTKGHPDIAIKYLEESIAGKQLDNSDIDAMVILGRLYRETKQYDKSINILQQANNVKNSYVSLLIDPMPPNKINFELGKTYFAMGRIKEAKEFMQPEKGLYEIQKNWCCTKENEQDYNELTHILNVQG